MSEEDKLFNFLSDLQPWAQKKLRRQGVKDIPSAMEVAKSLVDFHNSTLNAEAKGKNKVASPKPKNRKFKKRTGGKNVGKEPKGATAKAKAQPKSLQQQKKKPWSCFICGEQHHAKVCPKRGALNTFIAQLGEKTAGGGEPSTSRLNPL